MTNSRRFFKLDYSASPSALLLAPLCAPGAAEPFADLRAENEVPSVVHFEPGWGGRENDLIGCTFVPAMFGSASFRSLVEGSRFSGVSFYDISVKQKGGKPTTKYSGLRIAGRCGPIDKSRSARVTRMQPAPRQPYDVLLGLFFEEDTWDGSDFFVSSDGTGFLFVTESVAGALRLARLKGIEIRMLEEVEIRAPRTSGS